MRQLHCAPRFRACREGARLELIALPALVFVFGLVLVGWAPTAHASMVNLDPNTPMAGAALTLNGGESDLILGIPTPDPDAIPEPSTFVLLIFGVWSRQRRNG